MAKDKKGPDIEYQFLNFELDSHKSLSIEEEPKDYGYSVQMGKSEDLDENLIYIIIDVSAKIGPKSNPFFQAKTVSTFGVKNLSNIYEDLPKDFIANLMAISYSTARGYLMALNKDNFLEHSALPLLSIQQITERIPEEEIENDENDE